VPLAYVSSQVLDLDHLHDYDACCRYNAVNSKHAIIAKELEKAHTNFKEFERKDIKYRSCFLSAPKRDKKPSS
jgi:hypothetical protein